jgi:CBS domain-containing protein
MDRATAGDLMVPLEEYATVSEEATLRDAADELEQAQEELDRKRYKYLHKAVLVLDNNNEVVGKITQLDILRGLEPNYKYIVDTSQRFFFNDLSANFLSSMMDMESLWAQPLCGICAKAADIKVKDMMMPLAEGESIDAKAALEGAMHMMVMGHHHSLLVKRDGDIEGILRLTDVFSYINDLIKRCNV